MRAELQKSTGKKNIPKSAKREKTYCQLSERFSTSVLISFVVERHLFRSRASYQLTYTTDFEISWSLLILVYCKVKLSDMRASWSPLVGEGEGEGGTITSFRPHCFLSGLLFILSSTRPNAFASILECFPFLLLMFLISLIKLRYRLVCLVNEHNKGWDVGETKP